MKSKITEAKLINDDSGVQWSEVTTEMSDGSTETFSVQLVDGQYNTADNSLITVNCDDGAVDFEDYPEVDENDIIDAAESSAT